MATTSAATAATRRASRSTSPGEDPLLFDLGTGLRYFGLGCPSDEPFRGSCLLSHLHWDHVQGLPFFGPLQHEASELVVYAPAQRRRPHGRRGAVVDDLPADVPDRPRRLPRPDRHPRTGGQVPHRRLRHRERRRPPRRRGARLPGDARQHERRLHQRPPAAARAARTSPTACSRCARASTC